MMPMLPATIFSPCRTYRYALWRQWIGGVGYAMFIGLNPSTADETHDDPTVRRCIRYVQSWGYEALCMMNIFAYRATDPAIMKRAADPIGPENDQYLKELAEGAGIVVAAWGVHGQHQGRDKQVIAMLPELHCLKITGDGCPGHPLYLSKSIKPILWRKS